MRRYEIEWRDYLLKTFQITPESRYLNINEMETMIRLRDEMDWEYKPISYQEYIESIYGKELIPKQISRLKIK